MAVPTVASGCANSAKSGVEALEAGDYKEAQAQFEKLTEEKDKKKSAEGYRGLAMTYYEQEEHSSALDAFKKAVDTGVVQTTQIYNLMGVCAMKTEDYEAALEYIQAGLAMAETDMSGEEEKNSENGKDSAEMIQEMRYNEVVCYEKLADWENAKQKASAKCIHLVIDDQIFVMKAGLHIPWFQKIHRIINADLSVFMSV